MLSGKALRCVVIWICVYVLCVQEAQWQTGSGPADEDDGRHAFEGRSGSAEWGADWGLPGRQTDKQKVHKLLCAPMAGFAAFMYRDKYILVQLLNI